MRYIIINGPKHVNSQCDHFYSLYMYSDTDTVIVLIVIHKFTQLTIMQASTHMYAKYTIFTLHKYIYIPPSVLHFEHPLQNAALHYGPACNLLHLLPEYK